MLLAVFCAGVALAVYGPRLLGAAGGPEAELITLLKRAERSGLTLEIPGSAEPLISATHHFDRLAVSYNPSSGEAFVAATLDFDGHLGQVKVSSLGVEKIRLPPPGRRLGPGARPGPEPGRPGPRPGGEAARPAGPRPATSSR